MLIDLTLFWMMQRVPQELFRQEEVAHMFWLVCGMLKLPFIHLPISLEWKRKHTYLAVGLKDRHRPEIG